MATVKFKHLRYFRAVAKSGSIAHASAQLHVTPQSITSQLAELEEALGTGLFRRVGCGIEMTDIVGRVLQVTRKRLSAWKETVRRSACLTIKDRMSLAHRLCRRHIDLTRHPVRRAARAGN